MSRQGSDHFGDLNSFRQWEGWNTQCVLVVRGVITGRLDLCPFSCTFRDSFSLWGLTTIVAELLMRQLKVINNHFYYRPNQYISIWDTGLASREAWTVSSLSENDHRRNINSHYFMSLWASINKTWIVCFRKIREDTLKRNKGFLKFYFGGKSLSCRRKQLNLSKSPRQRRRWFLISHFIDARWVQNCFYIFFNVYEWIAYMYLSAPLSWNAGG